MDSSLEIILRNHQRRRIEISKYWENNKQQSDRNYETLRKYIATSLRDDNAISEIRRFESDRIAQAIAKYKVELMEKIEALIPEDSFGKDRDRLNADDVIALINEESQ